MNRQMEQTSPTAQDLGITKQGLDQVAAQLLLLDDFVHKVLRPNEDYGVIPGTDKPTLLKPGAANIVAAYNCHSEPTIDTFIVDPDKNFVSYEVHVDVIHNTQGAVRARGFGQCNSFETKYRYRDQKRVCPECKQPTINKSNRDGGWYCWRKQGGCGATFNDGDESIESQKAGKINNPDALDLANTIKKMAIKRAEVDAALRLPGVARFFTQDMEELTGQAADEDKPKTGSSAPATQAKPAASNNRPAPTPPQGDKNVPEYVKLYDLARTQRSWKPVEVLQKLGIKEWWDWTDAPPKGQGKTLDDAIQVLGLEKPAEQAK